MEEVEIEAVEPVAQEVASPTAETTQESVPVEPVQEDRNDRNWRELRRARDDWERKAKMQEEILQRLMSQQSMPQSANLPVEEDLLGDIAKEEYVPGVKVAQGLKKLEEKFDRRVKEIESRYEKKSLLDEARKEYADFDQVVTSETLDLIEETNPRLAASLAKTAKEDPYSFAIQSYEYIKSKGLSSPGTQSKRVSETERKIEQNKKIVQSPQAFDKRPVAQAFQYTEQNKKELQAEMYKYAQQAGMGY